MNIHWPQQLRQNYYSAFYRWGTLRLPKVKTVYARAAQLLGREWDLACWPPSFKPISSTIHLDPV